MKFSFQKVGLVGSCLVIALTSLSCSFLARRATPTPTPIPVSTEAAGEVIQEVESAVQTAASGGEIRMQFSESELTSIASLRAAQFAGVQVKDIQVRLRDGQIMISGEVTQDGFDLPLQVALKILLDAQGQPHTQVVDAAIGPIPLPQSLLDEITSQVDSMILEQFSSLSSDFVIDQIIIADGVMTVVGHNR